MTQEESIRNRLILDLLISLKDTTRLKQVAISRLLGYPKDIFNRLKSEPDYAGTKQLLAGCNNLLKLEQLKKEKEEWKKREHIRDTPLI